jgi:hypothetical protein
MVGVGNCGGTVSQQDESGSASAPITHQTANPTIELQRSTTTTTQSPGLGNPSPTNGTLTVRKLCSPDPGDPDCDGLGVPFEIRFGNTGNGPIGSTNFALVGGGPNLTLSISPGTFLIIEENTHGNMVVFSSACNVQGILGQGRIMAGQNLACTITNVPPG